MRNFVSNKSLLLVHIISLILSVISWLIIQIDAQDLINGSSENIDKIGIACTMFNISLICLVLLVIGYVFLLKTGNEDKKKSLVLIGLTILSLLLGLIMYSTISSISLLVSSITSQDWGSVFGTALPNLNDVEGIKLPFMLHVLFQMIGFVCGGLFCVYLKKDNDKEIVCSKCKNLNPKNAEFCGHCGSKLSENDKDVYVKKKSKVLYLGIAGIGLLVLVIFGFGYSYFTKPVQISLTSNCEYSMSGNDGSGTIQYSCMPDFDDNDERQKAFMDTVDYEIENNEDLSNGDVVIIKAVYDENVAKENRIEPIDTELEIEVSGLEKEKEIKTFSKLRSVEEFIDILKEHEINITDKYVFDDSDFEYEQIHGVIEKAYFEDGDYEGQSPKSEAYLTGGTIEICESSSAARSRLNQVNELDVHRYMYNYVFGNIYIRLDKVMPVNHIKEYEEIFDKMNDVNTSDSEDMRKDL